MGANTSWSVGAPVRAPAMAVAALLSAMVAQPLIPKRPPRDLALNPLSEEEVEAANCIRRLLRRYHD